MKSYLEYLFEIAQWPLLLLTLMLIGLQGYHFRRVPMKEFDGSALIFLLMITCCMISRTISIFIKAHQQDEIEGGGKSQQIVDVINMITDLAYWILLDFFILEMKTVKDIVSADSTVNFEKNSNKTKNLRYFLLPSLAICGFSFRFLVALKLFNVLTYQELLIQILMIVFRLVNVALQTIFGVLWFQLVTFYLSKKQQKLSPNIKLVMYLIPCFLLGNHFTLILSGIVELYYPTTTFYNIFCTLLYVVDPILIFVTTAVLQRLFYIQTSARYLNLQQQSEEVQKYMESILEVQGSKRSMNELASKKNERQVRDTRTEDRLDMPSQRMITGDSHTSINTNQKPVHTNGQRESKEVQEIPLIDVKVDEEEIEVVQQSWQGERAGSTNLKWYLYQFAAKKLMFNETKETSNDNETE